MGAKLPPRHHLPVDLYRQRPTGKPELLKQFGDRQRGRHGHGLTVDNDRDPLGGRSISIGREVCIRRHEEILTVR